MTQPPIVHIGYHKTGTTWFQQHFYPACADAHMVRRRNVRRAFLCPTAFAFDPDTARATLALPPDKRTIVCEEALCGYYENAGYLEALSKDVAYRIRRVFPGAQIVIFLRNQLDMLTATYLQYIRRGGTAPVERFLYPYHYQRRFRTKAHKRPMFCLDHFDYHHLIRHYQSVFGAANVHVFLYEDFRNDRDRFLQSYCRHLELDLDYGALSHEARNVSYGAITRHVARGLNFVTVGDAINTTTLVPLMPRKVNEAIMNQLNRTPLAGGKVTPLRLFGPELVQTLEKRFAASNRIVAEECGLDLGARGYPVAEDPDEATDGDVRDSAAA